MAKQVKKSSVDNHLECEACRHSLAHNGGVLCNDHRVDEKHKTPEESEDVELPTSKLFRSVDPTTYKLVFNGLKKMREMMRGYRDDELLMYMLCRKLE